jgi:hypothetical protein
MTIIRTNVIKQTAGGSTTFHRPLPKEPNMTMHIITDYSALLDAYSPSLTPSGARNTHPVACAQCRRALATGAGREWRWSNRPSRPAYFCRSCHNERQALLDIQPEIAGAMHEIESWCDCYIPLGMQRWVADRIDRLVGRCGLAGADVARTIADRLNLVDDYGAGAIVRMAETVAAAICGGPVE